MDFAGITTLLLTLTAVVIGCGSRLPHSFAFAGMLAFAPFFRLSIPIGSGELGVRPEDVVLGILLVRCVYSQKRQSSPERQIFCQAYILLIAVVLLYLAFSLWTHPISDINFFFPQKAIGASIVLFVGHYCVQSEKDFGTFLLGVMLGGVMFAVAALFGVSSGTTTTVQAVMYDAPMYQQKVNAGQYLATWGPNAIGTFAGALLVVLCSILSTKTPQLPLGKSVLSSLSALFALTLIISYVRTAIVGFGVAFVFLSFRSFSSRRSSMRGPLLVAIMIAVGMYVVGFRREIFDVDFRNNRNIGQRTLVWEGALTAISENPFGYGVGVGDLALTPVFGVRASAHNDWLEFALEIGVPGALLALFTMFLAGRCLWVASRWRGGSIYTHAGVGLFIYFFVCSTASHIFIFTKQPFFLLAGFLAIADVHLRQEFLKRAAGQLNSRQYNLEVRGSFRPAWQKHK